MVDQRLVMYLAASFVIIILVITGSAGYGSFSLVAITLAIITAIAILLLAYADFLIFPLITRLLSISMLPFKNYTIPREQDAVIKYVNNNYYATGYVAASIYNYVFAAESVGSDDTSLVLAPEKWEKATMNVHFPFKFHFVSASEDIQNYREELETKRGLYEFQYAREASGSTPNPMGMENLQRNMRVIQAKIDRLGSGERPINTIMYIESTAVGVSEKDARDILSKQLNELMTVFNVFDFSMARVYGRDLYLLQKMNYVVPTLSELREQFQQQS